MWNAVLPAQLMSYRVHVTHIDLVNRQTSIVGSHGHGIARIQVTAIVVSRGQVIEDQLDRQARILRPGAPLPGAYIGLYTVGQRIHTRRCGDMRRQADNKVRVQCDSNREQASTGNDRLLMCDRIGNDCANCRLRACSRCGGDGVQLQDCVFDLTKPHPVHR